MDWQTVGEIVKVLGAVGTAAAAWFAAGIALRGLEKWRAETIGKRRHDVAANTLSLIYQMEEILREARGPFVAIDEMQSKEGIRDEIAQDANFAPEARLLKHADFFARFRTAKFEFAASFGKDLAAPFDELWRIRLEINHAVDFMLTNKEIGRSRAPDDRKLWQENYYTAFRHPQFDKDPIARRITDHVATIERVCRPAIG